MEDKIEFYYLHEHFHLKQTEVFEYDLLKVNVDIQYLFCRLNSS